jgi:hypothetical protein
VIFFGRALPAFRRAAPCGRRNGHVHRERSSVMNRPNSPSAVIGFRPCVSRFLRIGMGSFEPKFPSTNVERLALFNHVCVFGGPKLWRGRARPASNVRRNGNGATGDDAAPRDLAHPDVERADADQLLAELENEESETSRASDLRLTLTPDSADSDSVRGSPR